MKHTHNHDHVPNVQVVPVRFEFTHPTAKSVSIAGTFNQWQRLSMAPARDHAADTLTHFLKPWKR